MTTTFRPRVDAGVPAGGEFRAFGHSDVVPALGGPVVPATMTVAELIDAESARYGAGYRERMEAQYERITTDGGRTLFTQHLDARANPETRFDSRAISGIDDTGAYDQLAALGYTDINELSEVKRKNLRGISTILDAGITPERLAVLNAQPRHEFQWSAWEKEAYLTAPVDRLAAALHRGKSPGDQYSEAVTILHPDRKARLQEARDLDITDRGIVEATEHPLPVLAGILQELPESARNTLNVVTYANKGITAEHLKRFGTRACTKFDGKDLLTSGLAPKTVKALMTGGYKGDLDGMWALHDGGYETAADFKSASKAMGSGDPAVLVEARKHATGEQLERFRGNKPTPLTVTDAAAVGRLIEQGFTSTEDLREYTSQVCQDSNMLVDRKTSPYAVYAGFKPAGLTPEKLGELTRAGIPVSEAYRFAKTENAWADGERFRAEYADRQAALKLSAPRGWPYTETTFKTGK